MLNQLQLDMEVSTLEQRQQVIKEIQEEFYGEISDEYDDTVVFVLNVEPWEDYEIEINFDTMIVETDCPRLCIEIYNILCG